MDVEDGFRALLEKINEHTFDKVPTDQLSLLDATCALLPVLKMYTGYG